MTNSLRKFCLRSFAVIDIFFFYFLFIYWNAKRRHELDQYLIIIAYSQWRKLRGERLMIFINGSTLNKRFCLQSMYVVHMHSIRRVEKKRGKSVTRANTRAHKTNKKTKRNGTKQEREKWIRYVGSEANWMSNTQKPRNDKQLHLEIDPEQW